MTQPNNPVNLFDLVGMIPTVAVAPTHTPRRLLEQFVLYANSGVLRLYFYDTTNGVWNYVQVGREGVYTGQINQNGTAGTPFPSGWSVARRGGFPDGSYTVTHNLGNTNYVVMATGALSANTFVVVQGRGTNTFDVSSFNDNTDFTDNGIFFTLLQTI